MTDSVIGAARFVFGADTVALETALKDTSSRVKQFSGQMQAMGAQFQRVGTLLKGAAAIGVIIGVGVAINNTMKEIEKLGDTASEIGIPVEQLTALKHAAESSGASIEALSVGMKTLVRNMTAAAADAQGSMSQAFRAVGVSVTDVNGTMRSSTDVLLDFADRMSGFRDGAGKTALVMQLFGEQGTKLIRMLNKGSGGIKEMTDEANRLGITIGDKSVASAQRYNAAIDRIGKGYDSLKFQITTALAPALEYIAEKMEELSRAAGSFSDVVAFLSARLEGLRVFLARVAANAAITRLSVKSMFEGTGADEFLAQVKQIKDALDATERAIAAGGDMSKALGGDALDDTIKKTKELKTEIPDFQGALKKLRDEFNYKFSDPFAGVATKMGLLNDAFKRGVIPLMEYKTMLRQLQVEDMAELRTAAKATLEDTLADGAVNAADKMRALEQAVKAGTITFGEFGAKAKSVTQEAMATVQASLEAFSSGMESAFREFTDTGKVNFKDMTRSILADLAQIAFKMMVLKPLFGDGGSSAGLFGSLLKGAFAPGGGVPGFAGGGRPAVGMPAWVGERGKELFVPDTPGTIIPNHMLQDGNAGGGQIVVRVEHSADFYARVDTRMGNVVAQSAPAIVGASVDATRRNFPGMMRQAQTRSL